MPGVDRARVMIVEDHPVIRGLVRQACERSGVLEVIGEALDGSSALSGVRELTPDVVVLDLHLPGAVQGLDVARTLRRERCPARILVLTARTDDAVVFESIRAGVEGFIDKSIGVDLVVDAIARVGAGQRVFTLAQERAARDELGRLARQAREVSALRGSVSERQLEILRYASVGLTVKQIARRMELSPRTVESHIAQLYRRLGVRTRVQAIARAASLDLIRVG